jgi:DNA/RNA endonuclease YhcR with UshA esterase domain
MEEKTLLKVSLIIGLVGILVLYFISSEIDLETITWTEGIEEEENIKIAGVVGRVSEGENVVFLEILNKRVENVKVVLFKEGGIVLSEGDYVEVQGTVEEWEGEKEIIGNKIVKK